MAYGMDYDLAQDEADAIRDYLDRTHIPQHPGLERARTTPERTGVPDISVGASEGHLLGLLLKMIGARRVVEIGTLVGYSTIHLARALPAGGRVWTLEADPRHAALARENLAAAGVADRVELIEGPAMAALPDLVAHGPFDAVFVDADKLNYPNYGRWAAEHLRPGGLLIGDNAVLFGQLLDGSAGSRAMRLFHEEAAQRFDSVCIPTPEGILLGIKKA
jgi:predicted O-methyltransferase YrrM